MMAVLIGIALALAAPYIIYRYILKGRENAGKKVYLKIFLLGATLYSLPIIILEVIWDAVFGRGEMTLSSAFSQAFLRAALIEEAVKYLFSYMVLKKHPELGRKESILLAGAVGIGYGFIEKLVLMNGAALFINAVLPAHMLFQWITGAFLFRALRSEGKERRINMLLAFALPFLLHGIWDTWMNTAEIGMAAEGAAESLGVLAVLVWLAGMFTAMIISARKLKRLPD